MRFPLAMAELERVRSLVEAYYHTACDIEFTIERGKLYVLSVRPAKMTAHAEARVAIQLLGEGVVEPSEAILRISARALLDVVRPKLRPHNLKPLGRGLPASPGAASGEVVFSAERAVALASQGKDVVLWLSELSPGDIPAAFAARAIVTSRGGMTSHAAVVARGIARPCVAGAAFRISADRLRATLGNVAIRESDIVTVDGSAGVLFRGGIPIESLHWSADDFAVAVVRLVEHIHRSPTSTDSAIVRAWTLRDIIAHGVVPEDDLEALDEEGPKSIPHKKIRRWHALFHQQSYLVNAHEAEAVFNLLRSLIRIPRERVGLGNHYRFFRPMWDPAEISDDQSQLVGFHFHHLNAFVPFWPDIRDVRLMIEVDLTRAGVPWQMDYTNPRGPSLRAGSRRIRGVAIWINGALIARDELIAMFHILRSREYRWEWFSANGITESQLRDAVARLADGREISLTMRRLLRELGLLRSGRLTRTGRSFMSEPEEPLNASLASPESAIERAKQHSLQIVDAVLARGYVDAPSFVDDYSRLLPRREFQEAVVTELYEAYFAPARHEFEYELLRELVEAVASLPATAWVATALAGGIVGNAAYDAVKQLSGAIARRLLDHGDKHATSWQDIQKDLDTLREYFATRSIATSAEIEKETHIDRERFIPLLKLIGFSYDRRRGQTGWRPPTAMIPGDPRKDAP